MLVTVKQCKFSWRTWCSWSRSCSCRPWRRHQACSSGHIHNPRTPLPGAAHCTPRGHRSHPETQTSESATGQVLQWVRKTECCSLSIPGRSPCLPQGIQHRTCWRWSVQGRHSCSCCHSGWGHPGTSGGRVSWLKGQESSSGLTWLCDGWGDVLSTRLVGGVLTARGEGVSPSRDQTTASRAGIAGGQGHGADVAVQGGGLAQLDQHDVVIQVAAAVSGVLDDLHRVDELLCAPRRTWMWLW